MGLVVWRDIAATKGRLGSVATFRETDPRHNSELEIISKIASRNVASVAVTPLARDSGGLVVALETSERYNSLRHQCSSKKRRWYIAF